MRRCTKCGEVKLLSEFYPHKKGNAGYSSVCKSCDLQSSRERRAARPDLAKERNRRYHAANRERQLAQFPDAYVDVKAEVLEHYGTVCACCGTTEDLTIDHPNGDGYAHREELFGNGRSGGGKFYRWLKQNDFPPGYQTLCRSCNSSKQQYGACKLHATGTTPLTASELRGKLADRVETAHRLHEPTIITRRGEPIAVLISYEEWVVMKAAG